MVIMLGKGGIGLVNFAFGLACAVEKKLMEITDELELSEFLQDLK